MTMLSEAPTAALAVTLCLAATFSVADSRRIEVYSLSQTFVDVRPGDTLSEIAASLLPNNPSLQRSLMQDVLEMNPSAFIDDDPDRLLAGRRIFLPNSLSQADSRVNKDEVSIESFSWGNVKRKLKHAE